MRAKTILLMTAALLLILLTACQSTGDKKELLLGTWVGDESVLEFRQFTSEDPYSLRDMGFDPQDGVFTMTNKENENEGVMGTYQLTDKDMLIFLVAGDLQVEITPGMSFNFKYLYGLDSISKNELVIWPIMVEGQERQTYIRSTSP